VEEGEQAFRVEPDIFVHKSYRTTSHQQDEDTLEQFEHGDCLENLTLAAMRICLGGGLGHECWRGLKAG